MEHLGEVWVDRYLDGDVSAGERAAIEAHLVGCAACRGEVAAGRALFAAFRALPIAPVPVDLTPRVLRRVGPEGERRPGTRLRVGLLAGALAAQAIVALALALWVVPPLVQRASPVPLWGGFDPAAGLRGWLPPRLPPLAILAPLQWALLVAGLAVVWAVGTRLALAGGRARPGGGAA